MFEKKFMLAMAIVLCIAAVAQTQDHQNDLWTRETLTDGFFGYGDQLADQGIELGFGMTGVYQQAVRGANKRVHQGRHTGSYDLELTGDLGQLADIADGTLYMHAAGSWSRSDIDATAVSSTFGVNADAAGRRAFDIIEVYYEQAMLDQTLKLRIGKLDIGGGFECRGCPVSFDGSAFANDETAQFLNGALVNNATIPFPDTGLGAVVYYNPIEWWYIGAGVIDAQADGRETGFNTTFHDEDYFFYVYETGVTPRLDSANGPLQGAYRIGLWNDAQPKAHDDAAKERRDDVGLYVSFDQALIKESDDAEDSQGLGAFLRFGYANSERNNVTNMWSAGLQYQGLLEGRDDDVFGVGFARGYFSNSADATFTKDHEGVVEAYYNAQVTPWLNISPGVQYIANPGGSKAASDAIVLGLRLQATF
jgi:porin